MRFVAAAEGAELTYEWRLVEGDVMQSAVLHALHADIAILGQNDPEHPSIAPHLPESCSWVPVGRS